MAGLKDVRLNMPVNGVKRSAAGVILETPLGPETFDAVVLACHSDQALALLGAAASSKERELLGAIRYQANRAVLHTDTEMLPQKRSAWAAWNYERALKTNTEQAQVCLHYLLNILQPLPWQQPVVVSLNPVREPNPLKVIQEISYDHPVFDQAAIDAQAHLPAIQGKGGIWYAGAWCGYGFHEDGYQAGMRVAEAIECQHKRQGI